MQCFGEHAKEGLETKGASGDEVETGFNDGPVDEFDVLVCI